MAQGQQYNIVDIQNLAEEFEKNILPSFLEIFDVKNDPLLKTVFPIKIVLTKMPNNIAGYFDNAEIRNEIFLNLNNLRDLEQIKIYLAHELQHLLSAYFKDKKFNTKDAIWLNELRSEYIPYLLGYFNKKSDNLLMQRVKEFLNNPFESFYPWKNAQNNYGQVAMFGFYLLDKLEKTAIKDMLKSANTGLNLIDEIASKKGYQGSSLYHYFAIANLLNDPKTADGLYAYNNEILNFKLKPELIISNISNFQIVINAFDFTIIELSESFQKKLLEIQSFDEVKKEAVFSSLVFVKNDGPLEITTKSFYPQTKNYFYIPKLNSNEKVYIVLSSAIELNQILKFNFGALEKFSEEFQITQFDFPIIKENTQPSFEIFGKGFLEPEILFSNEVKIKPILMSDGRMIFIFPILAKGQYNVQIKNLDGKVISLPQPLYVIENLPDGSLIRNAKNEKFITQKNLILPIDKKNKVLYNKKNVISVSEMAFLFYKITNLVKVKNDNKIYEIDKNGYRHLIKMTPEQFIASGKSLDDVFELSQEELSGYPLGRAIVR